MTAKRIVTRLIEDDDDDIGSMKSFFPPKPKSIHVAGRRWRDLNGNTYHTANVYVDGQLAFSTPRTYGYGSAYIDTAFEATVNHQILPPNALNTVPWRYCRENDIKFTDEVIDVNRKRDLG